METTRIPATKSLSSKHLLPYLNGRVVVPCSSRMSAKVTFSKRNQPKPLKRWQYAAYIRSPEWAAKKAAFKQSKLWRNGRCFVCCNRGVEMHVHHRTYVRLGNERLNDLRILCGPCHATVHMRSDSRSCSGMRRRWYAHANRQRLWGLRFKSPIIYAHEVAAFFRVSGHIFCDGIYKSGPLTKRNVERFGH